MEADSTTDLPQAKKLKSSSGGNAGGFTGNRGALHGHTHTDKAFAEKRKELIEVTSRFVQEYPMFWISPSVPVNPTTVKYQPGYSGTASEDYGMQGNDYVTSQVVNMYATHFVDDKVRQLSYTVTNPGYRKWRLKRFRVRMQLYTYSTTFVDQGIINYIWSKNGTTLNSITYQATATKIPEPIPYTQYYIWRDHYNDYADLLGNTNIDSNATNSTSFIQANNINMRAKREIQNKDTNLTIINNGEVFEFTREINAKAAYYISSDQINSVAPALPNQLAQCNPNTYYNIGSWVNSLEGIASSDSFTSNQYEGFNLLVVPNNFPTTAQYISSTAMHIGPNIHTKIRITYEADWDAWDFGYTILPQMKEHIQATLNIDRQLQEQQQNLPERKILGRTENKTKEKKSEFITMI